MTAQPTPSPNLSRHIGARVRSARMLARLTQEQLAGKADVSPSFISEIENGKSNPRIDILCKLASALKMPVAKLLPRHTT